MDFFVDKRSILREVWGNGDTILFIFAGAAAEFALNKAVDWLYFTGRLPADPLGRLFSTVSYSRRIIFSREEEALQVIDKMRAIHGAVEYNRGSKIPDWAYRDVLFMLIHYSIASYELLQRKLTDSEKEEIYEVFHRMGTRMGLKDLPADYSNWLPMREEHLKENLQKSDYTIDLYKQYKRQLGGLRYFLLIEGQALVVPQRVKELLNLGRSSFLRAVLPLYKLSRWLKIDWFLKSMILPKQYKSEIRELDVNHHFKS
jgi:hypothetical protein